MRVNEEYLDVFFASKLGKLEVSPPEDGWDRIENELNRRSRITRKYWLAAASFALILSATATMVYIKTNVNVNVNINHNIVATVQENTTQITDNQQYESDQIVEHITPKGISKSQSSAQLASISSKENMQVALQDDIAVSEVIEDQPIASNIPVYMDSWNEMIKAQPIKESIRKTMSEKIAQISLESHVKNELNTIAVVSPSILVYDEKEYYEVTSSFAKSQPRNYWSITGQFAPMFSYRAISRVPGGMQKSDFDAAESPLLAYSGGITLSRKMVSGLSVQIGIYYSQMGQSINNLYPVSNMPIGMSSINQYNKNIFKTSSGSVTATSNLKSDTSYDTFFNPESPSATNSVSAAISPSKYRLIEHLDYIEIPLMLRYKIIDKKLNFYVSGGMSTNVLINNNIFIDNGNELLKGGSILMARPVNFSSTLGLGVGYQINRNLSVEFEPLLKFFLQSYTTNSQIDSHPYAFGMFTGVVYRF